MAFSNVENGMDRAQKAAAVAELNRTFSEVGVVVVTRNNGMTVAQSTRLRNLMRDAGATYKVSKNKLAKIALDGTDYGALGDMLTGPVGLASSVDPVAAAKVAVEFAKTNDKFEIVGGAMGATTLDVDGVAALKKIRAKPNPPKIVMLTTFNVPDTVKAALTAGANGFLLKDADPETLIESVRTVAAGQTVLAADVVGHILPGALTVAADTLPSHVQQGLSLLTPREMEVLHAIGEGKTNAEIAAELVISATTVKTHVSNLLAKVYARDRVALAIIARKVGL